YIALHGLLDLMLITLCAWNMVNISLGEHSGLVNAGKREKSERGEKPNRRQREEEEETEGPRKRQKRWTRWSR
ncbi:MAG TPA: hypothetical protein VHV10_21865, partial [Ktedonobacteraceae bacterium]|nr:hypothetical protein [Ktedonobacteraceae bacterium]